MDVDGTPALLREPLGLAASPDPARRFDDVLHGMRLCSEIFGVMRTELVRRTSLHGSYYGSDKVLLAELAMLGRIETVPEPLFIKRFHKDTSYYLTTRERAIWIDPAASFRVPQVQVLKGYVQALTLVPLTLSQRARCLGSVARKVLNTQALRRLLLPAPDNYLGIERRGGPKPAAMSGEATRLAAPARTALGLPVGGPADPPRDRPQPPAARRGRAWQAGGPARAVPGVRQSRPVPGLERARSDQVPQASPAAGPAAGGR